ncbi:hypothetical protein R6Q59_025986 [Mikania micrantha]
MADHDGEGTSIEFTPTWVVAGVCTVLIGVSLGVERLLHFAGKKLQKEGRRPLFQALQKLKEELMLLGFVSLLLSVCQSRIVKICVNENTMKHFLPCSLDSKEIENKEIYEGYCALKNKVPLLSREALHHLHIFIFVLAVVHVIFSVLTVVFGGFKVSKRLEAHKIFHIIVTMIAVIKPEFTNVKEHEFIVKRFMGLGKRSALLGWLKSFFKQFYGSVTQSDYTALRLGFITTHCRGNQKFNFHKYMVRALEDDSRKVVGIRQVVYWYLWVFVIIFLLLNINGWHTYFWIAFIPLILLLAVGTKLEHIIIQLAHEVAKKEEVVEGEPIVRPSDEHFWFHRPKIVRLFIHFILFQNAFEIAFFFWILVQFGFNSCIMGKMIYIIPRLIIGVFIQVLCSYSTLPLYALVTQMGSNFKKSIFDEHIQACLISWAKKGKKKKCLKVTTKGSQQDGHGGAPREGGGGGGGGVELQDIHIDTNVQRCTNS